MGALTFDDLDGAPFTEDEAHAALNLATGGAATVTSGARTPQKNAAVGGVPNSMHIGGQAADFVLPHGADPAQVRAELERQGYPVSEWLVEKKGDPHSTGDHVHWGWRQKQAASGGPVDFSDLEGGAAQPAQGTAKPSGPITFDDLEGAADQTWGQMFAAHAGTTFERWKRTAVDAIRGLTDTGLTPEEQAQVTKNAPGWAKSVIEGRQAIANWATGVHDDLTKHIQEAAPDLPPGSAKQIIAQVEDGVIDLAPVLAAGYVTKGVTIPSLMMGGGAAADTYAAARSQGRTREQAQMDATFSGLVNGSMGALELKYLMKPGQSFLGRVLRNAGTFGGLGVVSEALQIGYDTGIVGQDMKLSDAIGKLEQAGIVGTLTGAFLGAGQHGLEAAAAKYQSMRTPAPPSGGPPGAPPGAPPRPEPKAATPRPQPRPNEDLLAQAAIPPPGKREPTVSVKPAGEGPGEVPKGFFQPEDLDPGFKTTPAKIVDEHAAEVSGLEAEGTRAAKPKPKAEEPPPNPYLEAQKAAEKRAGLEEHPDHSDRDAMEAYRDKAVESLNHAPKEDQEHLERLAGWAQSHIDTIDHNAARDRSEPVSEFVLPGVRPGSAPIASIHVSRDPQTGKFASDASYDLAGYAGGRSGSLYEFDTPQEALASAIKKLTRPPETGTAVSKRTLKEAAALNEWLGGLGKPTTGGSPETPSGGAQPAQSLDPGSEIGKSRDGRTLFEDKNGVRSYVENGVRVTEPVQLRPTRGGMQYVVDRGAHPEFATPDELKAIEPPSLPEPVIPQPPPVSREIDLARQVDEALRTTSGPIPAKRLQEMAEQVYGGTLGSGTVPRDAMYDAAELGLNFALRNAPHSMGHGPFSPVADPEHAERVAGVIREMKDRLPTQTVRAGEKETHQQFSTPPDYSYAAAWAANLHPSDVVLEPSAGTGSFVTHALNAGVREVHANDLSDRRSDMLRSLEPTNVTQENAEHIDAILPESLKPTVVLMNPPFSQTAGRLGTKMVLGTDFKHVEAALRKLRDGGRLVAILGGGAHPRNIRWRGIEHKYDVRANIGVEGGIYRKYGTTFPTRLVVIDKRPPSGKSPVAIDGLKSAAQIIGALKEIQDDRVHLAGESERSEPAGPSLARPGEGAERPKPAVSEPTGVVGPGKGGAVTQPGPAGGSSKSGPSSAGGTQERPGGAGGGVVVAGHEPERPTPAGAGVEPRSPVEIGERPAASGSGGARDGIKPDGSGERTDPGVTPAPLTVLATEESMEPNATDAPLTDAVYEPYTPQRVKIEGAKTHPGALVQSAAMASVLPPKAEYRPRLPPEVVAEGKLSDAQLEAVIYAGAAHEKMVPELPGTDGKPGLPERRRGFFVGDGTGVGKGREVSGIILDNWMAGRRKHLWISEKATLHKDARRDWAGLGQNEKDIFELAGTKAGAPITRSQGILFATYDTLKSGEKVVKEEIGPDGEKKISKAMGKTRVQQIIDWVGPDFDGVIAFDEAHNLGNSFDMKGNRGVKKAAAKALAGVELQNKLPKARVVYVSATGATEVSNLAYADRLGLWGPETAFGNRNDFLEKVGSGGIAAMELVARDLKATGRYIARSLSYDGVDYDRVEHTLTPEQHALYNKLADAWQLVFLHFEAAMKKNGITEENEETGRVKTKNANAKSAILSQFYGTQQRFFNQVITSLQMPTVLKRASADIENGMQVVFQLVNTNEAAQERALQKIKGQEDEDEALEDLDMSPRDQLLQLVSNAYPVQRFEEYADEEGNVRSRPVTDKDGNIVLDPELVAARERLLDELGAVRVPDGPLEQLLNHFGPEKLAEVTGRKQRVVRAPDPKTGEMKTVVEKRSKASNIVDADHFQGGKKPALVFSEAGGTGRSYHADISSDSADKRRSHYLLQGGWRADKAVQGFGRTHRTNQASAPIFHLVTTDLKGQKRFISSIARRLGQLGALTKGERRTGDQGLFGLRDNLESDEAKASLKILYGDVLANSVEGVSLEDFTRQMGLKLTDETGRQLQNMPPMTQFLNRLLSLRTDLQNRVFDALSTRLDDVLRQAAAAGTLDTGVETYRADKITKRGEQIVYTDPDSGAQTKHVHLESHRKVKPREYAQVVTELRKENKDGSTPFIRSRKSGKIFGVANANARTDTKTGAIVEYKRLVGALGYEYIEARRLDAGERWEPIDKPEDQVRAWAEQIAKVPAFAREDLHLITGAVLPIWDRLQGSPKVFRLQTDTGEKMLGRVIPSESVNETLEALGAQGVKLDKTPAQIATTILDEGRVATLANGWKIKRSYVAGEQRLELIGPDHAFMGQMEQAGVFKERIDWDTRFFIPTGERAAKVIEAVTKGRPIVKLAKPTQKASKHQRTPVFFSALRRAIEETKLTRGPAKDWLGLISNLSQKGVKQEEVDWSGVREWLRDQDKPVTKDEVLNVVRAHEVKIREVWRGEPVRQSKTEADREAQFGGLISEYDTWQREHGLHLGSADEHLNDPNLTEAQRGWIADYSRRWDAAENQQIWDAMNERPPTEDERVALRKALDGLFGESRNLHEDAAAIYHGVVNGFEEDIGQAEEAGVPDSVIAPFRDRARKPIRFGNYMLRGGQNPRELVLVLPAQEAKLITGPFQPFAGTGVGMYQGQHRVEGVQEAKFEIGGQTGTVTRWPKTYDHQGHEKPGGYIVNSQNMQNAHFKTAADAFEAIASNYHDAPNARGGNYMFRSRKDVFKSAHWPEPNVVAHNRFDDRVGPNGEKIMHNAEFQSDWHELGREHGYRAGDTQKKLNDATAELDAAEEALVKATNDLIRKVSDGRFHNRRQINDAPTGVFSEITGKLDEAEKTDPDFLAATKRWNDAHTAREKASRDHNNAVPDAPFKKSWHELLFKRALRYAVEHGYDKMTWDTGDTNADRYDLSQHIKYLHYKKNEDGTYKISITTLQGRGQVIESKADDRKLADVVGKDVAKKIIDGEGADVNFGANNEKPDMWKTLKGLDLKVGGHGMRGFYDKILVDFANKYVKKWGAKVTSETIDVGHEAPPSWEVAETSTRKGAGEVKVHAIDITPAMRESVMKGQPLFRREGQRTAPEQHPGAVRLSHDVVAELPHLPTPAERRVMDQVAAIAKRMVPKAEVVAARQLFAEGALADRREHGISGATMGDNTANGARGARRLIAWSLAAPDAPGTLRHEAIHWLRGNGFFKPSEWAALEKAARTGNWLGRHDILTRYSDVPYEGQIEEAIAEQFGSWRRAPRAVPEVARPMFERLAKLLGAIRDWLRQQFGHDTTVENIFRRIEAGEIGGRTPADLTRTTPEAKPFGRAASRFQKMDPEERDNALETAARSLINIGEDFQMWLAPMARGSEQARATAKDFANLMRASRDFGQFQMERLRKEFTPAQLKRMWEAADEMSIEAQRGRTDLLQTGLNNLTENERAAVVEQQADAKSVWDAMVRAGQVEGDGIPYYVPHLYVEIGEAGYRQLGSNRGVRAIPGMGKNLTTTSPHLKHRKYLTAEEGAAAASEKFGVQAVVLRDIRTLPLATMRNRTALAGFQLLKQIKTMGQRVGQDWVIEGAAPPGYIHIDNPSFFRWRVKLVKNAETSKFEPARDQNGQKQFERVMMSVAPDWEGPLRAIFSVESGPVYRWFMDLKMRTMNNIMFSPLVQLHLLTEMGRAFPANPMKVASLKILFEGNRAKNDPETRLRAIMAGLVPIGHRGERQEISSITEGTNLKPGRSWFSQIVAAVPGWLDPRAGDAVKRAIDAVGDVLHSKLLWDRVQDLQFGLFTTFSDHARAKGLSPETADRMAAHMANRYAGTLPLESMSPLARKLSNIIFFSRTYTLGNIGVLKDAIGGMVGAGVNLVGRGAGLPATGKNWGGLPLDIQAQIRRDAPEELAKVQSMVKRKTLAILAVDIALVYAVNSLAQNFFAIISGRQTKDEVLQGYLDRLKDFGQMAMHSPIGILNPIADLDMLAPTMENEIDPATGQPLRRILVGYDKQGTATYARNPLGKFGEEFTNWDSAPVQTLKSKLNALGVRPTLDVLANDRGFGRKIYNAGDPAYVAMAKVAQHYIESTLPMDQLNALRDFFMGQAKDKTLAAEKLAGRAAGVTFRRGAPGGPAVGLMYQARAEHEAKVQEALPGIREKILGGQIAEARRDMHALGIPPALQSYYIRTARNPRLRLTRRQVREFQGYATPEQRQQMHKLRQQGAPK